MISPSKCSLGNSDLREHGDRINFRKCFLIVCPALPQNGHTQAPARRCPSGQRPDAERQRQYLQLTSAAGSGVRASLAFRCRSEPSDARSRPVARRRAAARMMAVWVLVLRNCRRDHNRTGRRRRCYIADRHHTECRNSPSV